MKKIITVCLLLFTVCYSFAEKKVVKWVYMEDAEPLNWFDETQMKPMGIEVEIVQHIMNELDIEVEHAFYPWARAQRMIEQGQADGMITTPNQKRWGYASFGKEITVPNYWNIFINKNNSDLIEKAKTFKSLDDLKKYSLIDFIGNGWSEAFMKEGFNINYVSKLELLPKMLAANRADYIINSSNWINWWADKEGVNDKIVEIDNENIFFSRFHFVFMISRKSEWIDEGLLKAMDQELIKMKKSGKWTEILKKYKNPHGFGKEFKTQLKTEKYYQDYDKYPLYKS